MTDKVHATLGASGAYRWLACPGSVALAKTLDKERIGSIYAAEGSLAHDLAELSLTGKSNVRDYLGKRIAKDGFEFVVADDMIDAVETYVSYCDNIGETADQVFVEARVSLNEMWGGTPPVPLFGTADFIAYNHKYKILDVVDYKHGRGVAVEITDNDQLLYYAAGALAFAPGPVSKIITTIVQPRAEHQSGPIRSQHHDRLDLQIWFDTRLRPGVEKIVAGDTSLMTGDHCRFCEVRGSCPALAKLAMSTAEMEFGGLPPGVGAMSDKELGDVLSKAEIIREWIEAVRAEASQRIDRGAKVPGWKLAEKRGVRRFINEDLVESLLSSFGIPQDKTHKNSLLSVAQIEKLLDDDQKEAILPLIHKQSSGTTLVPENDRRPAVVKRKASDEFGALPITLT